jgi:acyl-CoA thioesterase
MKKFLIVISASFSIAAASAQEFTTTPRVAPQPEPARPLIEQNSNSSWFKKFQAAKNKFQLLNPAAPREYGSGEQVVVADNQDPRERPKFLRLFSIAF